MSEESMNDVSMNSDLRDLEFSLRGLSAASNVNRDELLFEAGRQAAKQRSASGSLLWKGVSTVLALLLAVQSFAYRSDNDERIADGRSHHERPATTKSESSTNGDNETPHRLTVNIPDTPLKNQESLPSRRSELLLLRRVALSQGVDAAFSSDTENADLPTRAQRPQRELLRELLGS